METSSNTLSLHLSLRPELQELLTRVVRERKALAVEEEEDDDDEEEQDDHQGKDHCQSAEEGEKEKQESRAATSLERDKRKLKKIKGLKKEIVDKLCEISDTRKRRDGLKTQVENSMGKLSVLHQYFNAIKEQRRGVVEKIEACDVQIRQLNQRLQAEASPEVRNAQPAEYGEGGTDIDVPAIDLEEEEEEEEELDGDEEDLEEEEGSSDDESELSAHEVASRRQAQTENGETGVQPEILTSDINLATKMKPENEKMDRGMNRELNRANSTKPGGEPLNLQLKAILKSSTAISGTSITPPETPSSLSFATSDTTTNTNIVNSMHMHMHGESDPHAQHELSDHCSSSDEESDFSNGGEGLQNGGGRGGDWKHRHINTAWLKTAADTWDSYTPASSAASSPRSHIGQNVLRRPSSSSSTASSADLDGRAHRSATATSESEGASDEERSDVLRYLDQVQVQAQGRGFTGEGGNISRSGSGSGSGNESESDDNVLMGTVNLSGIQTQLGKWHFHVPPVLLEGNEEENEEEEIEDKG